jgi:hypothetical protein
MAIQVSGTTVIDDSRIPSKRYWAKNCRRNCNIRERRYCRWCIYNRWCCWDLYRRQLANATDFAFGDTSSGIYPVGVKNSSVLTMTLVTVIISALHFLILTMGLLNLELGDVWVWPMELATHWKWIYGLYG